MKYHVLVVEDEPTLLHGIVLGLEKMQAIRVTGCPTAEAAFDVFRAEPPDLLLTDLNLPGHSGIELISQFRERYYHTPIIVMTAYQASYAKDLELQQDLLVLDKPISLAKLRSVVEERLSQNTQSMPIGPFQLVDYLQLAGYGRYSLILQVFLKDKTRGVLEIVEGDIWNAFVGQATGFEALAMLMAGEVESLGYVQFSSKPKDRQIHQRWEEVLIDLARLQDESTREFEALPSSNTPDKSSSDFFDILQSDDRFVAITDEDLASFASFDRLPQSSTEQDSEVHLSRKQEDGIFRSLLQALANRSMVEASHCLEVLEDSPQETRLSQPWLRLLRIYCHKNGCL